MLSWCSPILDALSQRTTPCRIFFRDDDAGWENSHLFALLDRFAKHRVPVDLAVIPVALGEGLAQGLLRRIHAGQRLGIHQHGFAHVNQEPSGRKCEFGASRSYRQQRMAIESGHALIAARFGTLADRIFTPPWNRCTEETADALIDLGFDALSRDITATPFGRARLAELPVTVDWCKLRPHGGDAYPLGERIGAAIAESGRCGIMLHHAVMDSADLALLDGLLPLLADHALADCVSMRSLLPPAPAAAGTAAASPAADGAA